MIYLSQILGKPLIDAAGSEIGTISDISIATGEVFPRVTSLAFLGPDKTPFMLSWRKYVAKFDVTETVLNVPAREIRFSYLQPDEVLLHRDLLNKQIIDTQGMKVVRVNDLKLSESRNQLRLLGAEVGLRGVLRGISPVAERFASRLAALFGGSLSENLIAWNYMDLLDRDLSQVKLSVTHRRLHELHPADVADILEQLAPPQRAAIVAHLDNEAAADTITALEDEFQADIIDGLPENRASELLAEMDPDDAADIIGDLPNDKAERLLRLMGVEEARAIHGLLGYKEKTAGGIMTSEVTTVTEEMTVGDVIEHLREVAEDRESTHYIYVIAGERQLTGVISLRDLLIATPDTPVADLATRDLFTASPDDDQELVAEQMSKYDLLAMPVVDENGVLLGIVTVDDALDVLEEEAEEDLALATGAAHDRGPAASLWWWIMRRSTWAIIWIAVLFGVHVAVQTFELWARPEAAEWLAGSLSLTVYASILLPILLRTGEESSSRAVMELISGVDEVERPSLPRRLLTEGGVGLGVGGVAGLVGFGLVEIVAGPENLGAAALFGVITALAVLLTVLFCGLLAELALRRSDKDEPVSSTMLSTTAMLFSAAIYIGLSFAGGWLLSILG